MKKIFLSVICLFVVNLLIAQTPKTVSKTVPKPASVLKTKSDSVNYVLGELAAFAMKEKGLENMKITNSTVFIKGMRDILEKKPPLVNENIANILLSEYFTSLQLEKIKPEIQKGEKFLAQNKLKPGIKTTSSGLQYEIITEGTGIKPTIADTFVVHYRGTLLDGTEFDGSYKRNTPLVMPVSQVIAGWQEGLQLMAIGSKYKFWIPYNIGYGAQGNGSIPGGAMLIFDLELLDIKKKQ